MLPANAELIIGAIAETVAPFLETVTSTAPLGYVVLDVDYYSSSIDCLRVFTGSPDKYLPNVLLFADDITFLDHNDWQGELLALTEFNGQHEKRKISRLNHLAWHRVFRNALWVTQMFHVHILDSALHLKVRLGERVTLENPYLQKSR
jgi:hypothetical protein